MKINIAHLWWEIVTLFCEIIKVVWNAITTVRINLM